MLDNEQTRRESNKTKRQLDRLPPPPPLPSTTAEMLNSRLTQPFRTVNDDVDDIHLALWRESDEETDRGLRYRSLLLAIYDPQAVSGSLRIDDVLASLIIKEYAAENGIRNVASEREATIVRALRVVLRRFGLSRERRRSMVDGEVVRNNDRDDSE